jgi:hypothetical protein
MYEALLCTLIVRADGEVTLPVQDVVDCGNRFRFCVRPDHQAETLTMTVFDVRAWRRRRSAYRGRNGRRRRHDDPEEPTTEPPADG